MSTFPLHAVDIYDNIAAIFGTVTVTVTVDGTRKDEQDDLDLCVAMFDAVRDLAVFGDDARAILADEAAPYRER